MKKICSILLVAIVLGGCSKEASENGASQSPVLSNDSGKQFLGSWICTDGRYITVEDNNDSLLVIFGDKKSPTGGDKAKAVAHGNTLVLNQILQITYENGQIEFDGYKCSKN